jgi:protein N-terminal methyltransferase
MKCHFFLPLVCVIDLRDTILMVKEKKPKDKAKKKKTGSKAKKIKVKATSFDCMGFTNTTPARVFKSIAALWEAFPVESWYSRGDAYWEKTSADENGMLGGLLELKEPDEAASLELLRSLQSSHLLGNKSACDVGGGIGRVSKNVLMKLFERVDLVEQNKGFLEQASIDLPDVGRICCGLQDFAPAECAYDVIWVQWVTGHLRDEHFASFLQRALSGLAPNGVLVIKDNTSSGDEFVMDCDDHSITRSLPHYNNLFKEANKVCQMRVLSCTRQQGFPDGVFPVYTWVIGCL